MANTLSSPTVPGGSVPEWTTAVMVMISMFSLAVSFLSLVLHLWRRACQETSPSRVAATESSSRLIQSHHNPCSLDYPIRIRAFRRNPLVGFSGSGMRLPFGQADGSTASNLAMMYMGLLSLLNGDPSVNSCYLERIDRLLNEWLDTLVATRRDWALSQLDTLVNAQISVPTRVRCLEEIWTCYSEWVMGRGNRQLACEPVPVAGVGAPVSRPM